jgi:putative transposase
MTKEERVIAAVNSFNAGKDVKSILTHYKCSKSWLYKWLSRYKSDPSGDWYKEESRRPKKIHSAISDAERKAVIAARLTLENQPYSQRGAISIQYELKSNEQLVVPVWKINRILKQANLNSKKPKQKKVTNEYPVTGLIVDQMDFVGPRYIKNDGRYYSLNIIDITTHFVHVNPLRSKDSGNVIQCVVRFWKQRGIPDFLQMDNELSFRGSNRHPHSFSKLIRLALYLRITVIFIPIKEPWRNGIIEKFNDSFNKRFIKGRIYSDFKHLQNCAKEFEDFHNQYHRYAVHKNHTPEEQLKLEIERDILPANFIIPDDALPLKGGRIILIRFIRSNRQLDVFGEKFLMPSHLEYSYVEAVIDIDEEKLYVVRDCQVQWETYYKVNQSTMW